MTEWQLLFRAANGRDSFILEGLFTVVVGVASKFAIPDWPENAKFLSPEEKQLLIARLTADVADAKMNRLDKRAYKRIFSDWKMYCGVLMYFGIGEFRCTSRLIDRPRSRR